MHELSVLSSPVPATLKFLVRRRWRVRSRSRGKWRSRSRCYRVSG
ncbi:hypothetical protein [Lyngbya sp. CCY1209]|nr:hypothetical protein [Lyngbya sp. CCY1209]